MKLLILVIITILSIPCFGQFSEGIDSFEYAEITTEEYCVILTVTVTCPNEANFYSVTKIDPIVWEIVE